MAPWHHAHDCFWALMSVYCSMAPSSWVFMDAHECSLAIRNTHGCSWLLICAHECQWVLMSAHDCSWKADRRSHEHSWTWAMEQWALMRAQKQSWAWYHGAMGTHHYSWALTWIFSESTQNGLLKNVQDEISTPLGSREIQKTKVYTVLVDTLYQWFFLIWARFACNNNFYRFLNNF